ncbi:MAG: thermonuclease family protein [Candidatus Helarchaeota archaeon]
MDTVRDLISGSRNVFLRVKVLEKIHEREVITRKDGMKHRVSDFLVGDHSGKIKLVLWDNEIDKVKVNSEIEIKNGYVDKYFGELQLNLGLYGSLNTIEPIQVKDVISSLQLKKKKYYSRSRRKWKKSYWSSKSRGQSHWITPLVIVSLVMIILFGFLFMNVGTNLVPWDQNPGELGSTWEKDASGMVTYIVDGDTLDVSGLGRIRLADIDTPESYEPGYTEAKNYLSSLVNGQNVFVDIDDIYKTDKYGRYVAVIYLKHNATHYKNINKAMLDSGHADITDYYNEFSPYSWSLYVI